MTCEKCWADAYLRQMSDPSKLQVEHYRDLIEERKNNPCVPENSSPSEAMKEETKPLEQIVELSDGIIRFSKALKKLKEYLDSQEPKEFTRSQVREEIRKAFDAGKEREWRQNFGEIPCTAPNLDDYLKQSGF